MYEGVCKKGVESFAIFVLRVLLFYSLMPFTLGPNLNWKAKCHYKQC